MEIELENGTIRSWRPDDRESLARHANDRAVWINLRDRFPHSYTVADAEGWLAYLAGRAPETNFAIAVGGEAVGAIGIELGEDVHRRSAEIGYWLGRDFWGRGLATAAVRAMSDWAFENFDLCRLQAGVFEGNAASARVLEKAGYVLEGRLRRSVIKDGTVLDQLLYALIR